MKRPIAIRFFPVAISIGCFIIGAALIVPPVRDGLISIAGRRIGTGGLDALTVIGAFCLAAGAAGVLLSIYWRAIVGKLLGYRDCLVSLTQIQWLIGVCVLSAILRFFWIAFIPVVQFSDFAAYDHLGWQLAQGKGYAFDTGPTAIYPPGYPLFLAGFYAIGGHRQALPKVGNALLGVLLVIAVYRFARDARGEGCARWASLLAAVYPPFIMTASLLASENLYLPLLVFGLFLFIRGCRDETEPVAAGFSMCSGLAGPHPKECGYLIRRSRAAHFALSGVLFSLAALTRTGIYLLPALLALWNLFRGHGPCPRRLANGFLMIVCSFLVIFPWIRRNRVVFGHWGIMGTNLGWTFYDTNTSYPFAEKLKLQQDLLSEKRDEYAIDHDLLRRGLDLVASHPGSFLRNLMAGKARSYLLGSPEWLSQYNLKRNPRWPSRGLNLLYYSMWALNSSAYYLLLLLSLAGLLSGFKLSRYSLLFTLVIGYNLGLLIISKGLPRYRLGIIPIFIFFAALFLERIMPLESRRGQKAEGGEAQD